MASADPQHTATLRALEITFPRASISRGVEYAAKQRVVDLQSFDGDRKIVAHVRGSGGNVYRATILLRRAADGIYIEGRCSCPVQFDCKHAVAAALDVYADRSLSEILDAPSEATRAPQTRPQVEDWLRRVSNVASEELQEKITAQELRWVAKAKSGYAGSPTFEAVFLMRDARGAVARTKPASISNLTTSRASGVQMIDRSVAQMLDELSTSYTVDARQMSQIADDIVHRLVAAGRLSYEQADGEALTLGPPLPGAFNWQGEASGRRRLTLYVEDADVAILPWLRPWYVDLTKNYIGRVEVAMSLDALRLALAAPLLEEREIAQVDTALRTKTNAAAIPLPSEFVREEFHDAAPQPHVAVYLDEHEKTVAGMSIAYGSLRVIPCKGKDEIRKREGDAVHVYRRDLQSERALLAQLMSTQLREDTYQAYGEIVFPVAPERLAYFLHHDIDMLRAEGWQIEVHPLVGAELIDATVNWNAQLKEHTNRLFACDLGVEIDGERIPLTPVLMKLFRECGDRDPEAYLADKAFNGRILTRLGDGRSIALPLERVQRMAALLVELFNQKREGEILVSLPAAVALQQAETNGVAFSDGNLDALAARLKDRAASSPVLAPASLVADLRAYQLEGLRWLQFLREANIGGVLADDMGLGKTVQTLAHILLEKEQGRLLRPALVIAPTSVVPNWANEAKRFAPGLRVLVHHGAQRGTENSALLDYDLVISSYPLLLRDTILSETDWYMAVLDEAQTIKNAQSKVARAARNLSAGHRLALSGTPIENHLGELWSIFEFLMPGAFGDLASFHRTFRVPIEKKSDGARKQLLIERVRPFILRRTKDVVATELPPKTEIVQRIELHPDQLDLYETVRVAMDRKVRTQMKEHGLARSRIVVLDALLKLRQVCCDARLVKLPSAREIRRNAKLETLLSMLHEMLEEGRRIIVFSQFTSMLALIEKELARRKIAYALLTGETVDRKTPVAKFQAGEVAVFLISVKAGGTGLNLTAADTVIHYDPWWNPAVERQATDRAHRIGQTKPVFVYKLVIQGSIEERILEMQERKGELARALLDDSSASLALEEDDLERLLAPVS